jgi:signal transduction histidine kinase
MGPVAWWDRAAARWRASTRLQDVTGAVLTFLVGLALNLVGLTQVYQDARLPAFAGASVWWHTVPLGVGCAVMLFKRRHPVVALSCGALAVAIDTVLGGSLAMVLVLFELLFSAGLYASARARTTIMSCVVVIIGTVSVVTGLALADLRPSVFIALQLTGLLVVPLWWAANLRQQRELGQVNAERARHGAIEAERAAMARELHDVIAGHLSTTAIHSAAALALPAEQERDRAALRAVRESSLAALEEMRSMITLLRADRGETVAAAGLERLPDLVASARATGLDVTLDPPPPLSVPSLVGQAGYRIVNEALTNARKHSPGSRVRVTVSSEGEFLSLAVTNTLTRHAPLGMRRSVPAPACGAWPSERSLSAAGSPLDPRETSGWYG